MKALQFPKPHEMELTELPRPVASGDMLVIRIRASGICGTDVHIYEGGFTAEYPLVPGHEFAGEVVETGPDCTRFKVGDRVAVEPNVPCNNCPECLRGEHHFCSNMVVPGVNRPGGMAEYVLVGERAAFDIGDLPFELGALVEPLSCVIHATERMQIRLGERVLIMGAGPIGLMMGRLVRARGAGQVDFLERSEERRAYAARDGLGEIYGDLSEVPEKAYDCAADAAGSSVLVTAAADRLVRPCGRVLVFGVPAMSGRLEINHFRFYREEISLIASFTSLKNSMQAIEVMRSGVIRVDDIVSHKIRLSECPEYIGRMKQGDGSLRKVTIVSFDN